MIKHQRKKNIEEDIKILYIICFLLFIIIISAFRFDHYYLESRIESKIQTHNNAVEYFMYDHLHDYSTGLPVKEYVEGKDRWAYPNQI